MKDIIRFILRLVQNPIVLAILWFGVAIWGFWVSWTEGLANNYLIFSRSFFHALEQTPLYVATENTSLAVFARLVFHIKHLLSDLPDDLHRQAIFSYALSSETKKAQSYRTMGLCLFSDKGDRTRR